LRAFEAAARHLSYTRAAQELLLTHSAVSHHIRFLEDQLGKQLFQRSGRTMQLTPAGQDLILKVRQGLRLLERTFDTAMPAEDDAVALTLSVLPAFATRWLVPRLAGFHALHPQTDIDLRASAELAHLGLGGIDVAIRYGPGGWPGLQYEKLMDEYVFPVCSPTYRDGNLPQRVEDLAHAVLLRNLTQPWEPWFDAAGVDLAEPSRGPSFSDAALLLQAAAEGWGIALGRAALVDDDLRSGRLVRLFEVAIPDTYAYYVLWQADNPKLPAITAFRNWLRNQVTPVQLASGEDTTGILDLHGGVPSGAAAAVSIDRGGSLNQAMCSRV
jgi:DNA-binding transcriptional LysR family regulator